MDEIERKIRDPNVSFEEIISDPFAIKLYKFQNQTVHFYFKNHALDLIQSALSNTKTAVQNNSFTIIILGDPDILSAILRSEKFLDLALQIVDATTEEPYVLGRLSTIMLSCLQTVPDLATQSFGFIYHLLPHCSNPSVSHFFESIISDNERYLCAHKWLIDFGFVEYLFREFQKIDFEYVSTESNPYFDTIYEQVFSLYQILSKCATNPIIFPHIINQDLKGFRLIDFLAMDFRNTPVYLENARWKSILALTTPQTAEMMSALIPNAIKFIQKDVAKLPASIVIALDFINKMMTLYPKTVKYVSSTQLNQSLLTLITQFMNSSILLNSFKNFVEVSLKLSEPFAANLVSLFLPFLLDYASSRENRVVAPFCVSIIDLILQTAKMNPTIYEVINEDPGFHDFLKHQYKDYKKVVEKEYGNDSKLAAMFKTFF